MTTKKVFSASDAHPIVIHAKQDADSEIAHPILVDSQGRLSTTASFSSATSLGDGSKNVTTAGTRETLVASSTSCKYVIITAKEANSGTIWIGGSTVASGRGRPIVSLQAERIDIDDLVKIYLDSTVNGDGVTFVYAN